MVTELQYLAVNKEVDEDVDNESDSESASGLEFSSYSCTTSRDRRSDIFSVHIKSWPLLDCSNFFRVDFYSFS